MAGDTSIQSHITTLFSEKLSLEVPSVETDLFKTGMIDSLGFVELLSQIEQEFDVQISLDDLEIDNFRSIAKIAEFISQRREMG